MRLKVYSKGRAQGPEVARRARRQELTQTQLENKNPSERIVDNDNHLRDALKYLVLTQPDPARKTMEQKIQEAFRPLVEAHDIASAAMRAEQIKQEYQRSAKPVRLGRYRRSQKKSATQVELGAQGENRLVLLTFLLRFSASPGAPAANCAMCFWVTDDSPNDLASMCFSSLLLGMSISILRARQTVCLCRKQSRKLLCRRLRHHRLCQGPIFPFGWFIFKGSSKSALTLFARSFALSGRTSCAPC